MIRPSQPMDTLHPGWQVSGEDSIVETFSINVFDQKGNNISRSDSQQLKTGFNSKLKPTVKSLRLNLREDKENIVSQTKPSMREPDIAKRVSIKIQTSRSDMRQLLPGNGQRAEDKATQTVGESPLSTKTLLTDEYDQQDLNEHLKDAEVYLLQGDYDRMMEFLYSFRNKYRETNQRLEYRWNVLMAVCKLQKREYSDVAKFIEECRTLYDTYELKVSELDHLKLLNILGIVYTETNLYQLALLTLQSALVMAREHNHYELFTEVLNNLGVLYLKTGMVNEALEVFKVCYQKKLQITGADSPTLVSTVFNVVECYTRLERFEDAVLLLKDIRKLLTKNDMISDICEMHLRMGAIEHMRGRVKEAKACLELSKQYVTDQPDIRYGHLQHQIGLLEMTLGDRVRARKCLEEACKIYVGFTNKDNDLVKKGQANLQLLQRINQ